MSSSRSDDVTKLVCPSETILLDLEHSQHMKRMFHDINTVSHGSLRVFEGCSKGALRMFRMYLRGVSRMFQESFKDVFVAF